MLASVLQESLAMADLQSALIASVGTNARLVALLETKMERGCSRRYCAHCGARKHRSRSTSPRKQEPLRARLRSRSSVGRERGEDPKARPSSAEEGEDDYMRFVDMHFQHILDDTMKRTVSCRQDGG